MTTADLTEAGEQRIVDGCVEHVEPLREALVALQRYLEAMIALARAEEPAWTGPRTRERQRALDAAKRAEEHLDLCDTNLEHALSALGYTR